MLEDDRYIYKFYCLFNRIESLSKTIYNRSSIKIRFTLDIRLTTEPRNWSKSSASTSPV